MDDEQRLEAIQADNGLLQSPTTALRQSFNRASILSPPPSPSPARMLQRFAPPAQPTQQRDMFTAGGNIRTRLFASYLNPTTPTLPVSQQPAQRAPIPARQALPPTAYRNPRVRLVDLQRHSLPHEPDTPDGQARYTEQVRVWHQKHGPYPLVKPDEQRPYPLTPGTLPVSSGACFNCGGKHGDKKHYQRDCPVRDQEGSLPLPERAFRAVGTTAMGSYPAHNPQPARHPPVPPRSTTSQCMTNQSTSPT